MLSAIAVPWILGVTLIGLVIIVANHQYQQPPAAKSDDVTSSAAANIPLEERTGS